MPGMWKWGFSGEKRKDKMMICTCSREQFSLGEMSVSQSPESLTSRYFSTSAFSSKTAGDAERRPDHGNIEEAESSLKEGLSLNYEEARALLGRLEYQRGNIEAALHVFEGIDINAVAPKIRCSLARNLQPRRARPHPEISQSMSMNAVNLLIEAIFLKSKCLEHLGKLREAALECKIVLDTVEPVLLQGIPEGAYRNSKLHEIVSKAVELLPDLWKQEGSLTEAMAAYRRALLNPWALDSECSAGLQKDFSILLLYSGVDVGAPSLGSQIEGSYIPKNNLEEAILLLLILLRKFALKKIPWDPTIMEHLTFALAMSGKLATLANQVEELYPGIYDRTERWYTLSLCYCSEGQNETALNLLKMVLSPTAKPNFIPALLFASKLSAENSNYLKDAVLFARRALNILNNETNCFKSVATFLFGNALVKQSRSMFSEVERFKMQTEAHSYLQKASLMDRDSKFPLTLSLLNAEKRNLDLALHYANTHLDIEVGSSVRGWRLVALILSAQKQFHEAEVVLNAALDQTGKWEQGEIFQTKARIQTAQGKVKDAVKTYGQLLALVQAQKKSFRLMNQKFSADRDLELEAWQDLAYVYIGLEKWNDAETCLNKAKHLRPHCAQTWHARGALLHAQGQHNRALNALLKALALDPDNVPSLVSIAEILTQQGEQSLPIARSFLMEALKLDRNNYRAWYNLGIVHKLTGKFCEAAECFQAAYMLEQTAPVESFALV